MADNLRESLYDAASVSVQDSLARSTWEATTLSAYDAVYGPLTNRQEIRPKAHKELGANYDTADNND
jgi:hypothetical protein